MPGFLAMDPECYSKTLIDLKKKGLINQIATVYSLIGGYLSSALIEIEEMSKSHDIPFIVDMAHAHYLDSIILSDYSHLAFSFYATKVLPAGEGGLISTKDLNVFKWIKRFLMYDRFNYSQEYGINLRANELTACFIHELMTNVNWRSFFKDRRIHIAKTYRVICEDNDIQYLDFEEAEDYNAYKFVVFDEYDSVVEKNTLLTKFKPTSPVFAENILDKKPILPHWCPPTYTSLYDSFAE
jgi:dTDP-4-amino-4,6-dideoxygalactose transaminase